MATFQATKRATTLAPTIRTLANGVPTASRLNLAARAQPSEHDHAHSQSSSRSDVQPRWSGGASLSSAAGLVSKTVTTSEPCLSVISSSLRVKIDCFFLANSPPFQQRLIHTSAARKDAPEVPDYSKYRTNVDSNRALSYFMVGSLGVLSASVAKSSISEFLQTMAASADVLALAKVEVDLTTIPEGKNVIIKWRGKPVFIRHRTADEIQEARSADWKSFRDPQSDEDRVKKPEWLIMLGVCTHLGCVPIGEAGDFGGWYVHELYRLPFSKCPFSRFCPCHGSHYDICELPILFQCLEPFSQSYLAGRARKGPAPVRIMHIALSPHSTHSTSISSTSRYQCTNSLKETPSLSLDDFSLYSHRPVIIHQANRIKPPYFVFVGARGRHLR